MMRLLAFLVGFALLSLGVLAVVGGPVRSGAPSTDVEERYEGCVAKSVHRAGEPWAVYWATRVPLQDPPFRWKLMAKVKEWGIDSPGGGEPVPQPNAVVLADGSLSLRETSVQEWCQGVPQTLSIRPRYPSA